MKQGRLTKRQKEILDFLTGFTADKGYPPTLREISARFSIKSPKNAAKHLDALEKKGFLKRPAKTPRGISLVARPRPGQVDVPVAGRVRAGVPHLAVEDVTGYVTLDAGFFRCDNAFLLQVAGESMKGAGIDDGDYVLVRPQPSIDNNEICVAMLGDEATVKRFVLDGAGAFLMPENPSFEPIRIEDGGDTFSIIGKVISVIKRIGNHSF